MGSVDQLLRDLLGVFERTQIEYAIMGGFAVRAYGVPRATYDVDVTPLMDRDDLPALFDTVEELGYSVPDAYRGGWSNKVADMPFVKVVTFDRGKSILAEIFPC